MGCYYLGDYYSEGEYSCQGRDKYVCFENRWLLSLKDAPECREEAGGWGILKTVDVTLVPSEEIVGGWRVLKTVDVTLTPSEEIVGGWRVLKTVDVTLTPTGVPVCVPGRTKCVGYDLYTCSLAGQWKLTERNAVKCGYVPEEKPPKAIPWLWIGAGIAAASVVGLVAAGEEKK